MKIRLLATIGTGAWLIWAIILATTPMTAAPKVAAQELVAQSGATAGKVFSDVDMENRNYVAIKFLKERGIIEGYEDGSFRPGDDINRAETLKILFRTLAKRPELKSLPEMDFTDVKPTNWFYTVIKDAYQTGITNGYPDQLFHPEKPINRVEALKFVLLQEGGAIPATVTETHYSDADINAWYAPYAEVSWQRKLFVETRRNGGQLLPAATVSRGEYAELIYHLLMTSNSSIFGRASFYSDSLAGNGVAGEGVYDPTAFTAAHRTLPFETNIMVRNLANGKEVKVKINDRGPFSTGLHVDLSRAAFEAIAEPSVGIIPVEYRIIP